MSLPSNEEPTEENLKKYGQAMKRLKPRFMFAVVCEDKAGLTIQLLKTKKQAEEFFEAIK